VLDVFVPEVSFRNVPQVTTVRLRFIQSTLTSKALIGAAHFSISLLTKLARYCGPERPALHDRRFPPPWTVEESTSV
jgi:hypothetical protein